jgi:hypothetical protein
MDPVVLCKTREGTIQQRTEAFKVYSISEFR